MSTQNPGPNTNPVAPGLSVIYVKAHADTKLEREALRSDELIVIYTDPEQAASRVWAAVERSAQYEHQLVRMPDDLGVGLLDRVRNHALAARQAQQLFLVAATPDEELGPKMEVLKAKRESLLADARALVHRKLLKADQIEEISGSLSYRVIATEVGRLCNALRGAWDKIQGRTGVTLAELDETHRLAGEADLAIALKETNEKVRVEANEDRKRAFTLMDRSYNQLRRALTYILWDEGGIAELAPPLAAHRGRRGAKDDPVGDEPPAAPEVGAVMPAIGTTPVTGAAAPSATPKVGMPGSSPFIT